LAIIIIFSGIEIPVSANEAALIVPAADTRTIHMVLILTQNGGVLPNNLDPTDFKWSSFMIELFTIKLNPPAIT